MDTNLLHENHCRLLRFNKLHQQLQFTVSPTVAEEMQRLHDDFAYWAWRCVRIRDKVSGRLVPFSLNYAQRKALEIIESQRLNHQPLRVIMLKARQWGGSTLVQMYMAWIQILHRTLWHSAICAQGKETAGQIRGMFTTMLDNYPEELWEPEEKPNFRGYERSVNTRLIAGRDCKVTITSAENQEAMRGFDISMAHLSEVAFYKTTSRRSPGDLVRALCSGIPLEPYTFIALESTANGQGNYFHDEWQRAATGQSDKKPIFIPWHEIGIYQQPVSDYDVLWKSLTAYEREILWDRQKCTLEQIAWYHYRAREYQDPLSMRREFPSTPQEAFESTSANVFDQHWLAAMRPACSLQPVVGDITARGFEPRLAGGAKKWFEPLQGHDYVVGVDVGGRSDRADFSVIVAIDATNPMRLEVAAQWRGHCDMDLLGKQAAWMATYYNDALLVIESNTLESDRAEEGQYVLDYLSRTYPRLYRRHSPDRGLCAGFHTNRATKGAVISHLISLLRDHNFIEHDLDAMAELSQYECQPGGVYAARRGCHDDTVMARAIALYALSLAPAAATDTRPFQDLPAWL